MFNHMNNHANFYNSRIEMLFKGNALNKNN